MEQNAAVTVDISGRRVAEGTTPSAGAQAAKWGLTLLFLLAGLLVGLIGAFCHRDQAAWFGQSWPVGLAYAFAGQIGLFLALIELPGLAAGRRPGRLAAVGAAAVGWVLAVIWATYLGPPPHFALKGDVILANDWISIAYLIGGMVLATAAVYRAWLGVLELKVAERRR
jgi:Family of unknown function (DUF6113)